MTDPIADFLTRIRNAVQAKHRIVEVPASNIKKEITKILYDSGYILNYKFEDDNLQGKIKIALKYHPQTKQPAIKSIERISRPGLRKYVGVEELPRPWTSKLATPGETVWKFVRTRLVTLMLPNA